MKSLRYAAALVAAFVVLPASAATVIFDATIDPARGSVGGPYPGQGTYSIPLAQNGATFTIAAGDTVKGVLRVANGGSLSIIDVGNYNAGREVVQFFATTFDNYAVRYTSKMSFGGITGDYVGASEYTDTYLGYQFDFNQSLWPKVNANLTNSSFAFTSIAYEITLLEGPASTFRYATLFIEGQPTSPPPPVPEPSTWAMLVMGFGLLGLGLRSRRRLSLATAPR